MLNALKMSIKLKSGFIIVALITLIMGFISWLLINNFVKHSNEVYDHLFPEVVGLYQMENGVMEIKAAVRSLMIANFDKTELNNQTGYINHALTIFREGFQKYQNLEKNQEETLIWEATLPLLKKFEAATLEFDNLAKIYLFKKDQKSFQKIYERGSKEFAVLINQCITSLEKLIAQTTKHIAETKEETHNNAQNSVWVQIWGMSITSLVAVFLGIILSNSITKPILNSVTSLNEAAEQVARASEDLASTSQQLAEGNSEQAASIEQTSSTLEETACMVHQNSENTKEAALLAAQTSSSSEKGNEQMQEMLGSMSEIKKSSDQIAKIIKVIDEIAFQTNILALNAAVEAARAGEAGMGFAVVAEEVRNLAQRSAQAAKDTTEIIETNIELSETGLQVSEKVGESLGEITLQAKKVNELLDEIASASQEQSQGISQINKAMTQMEKVTQRNASGSEESAAASQEMSAQALLMQETVQGLFKLINGSHDINSGTNNHAKGITPSNKELAHQDLSSFSNNENSNNTMIINPDDVIPLEDDQNDF